MNTSVTSDLDNPAWSALTTLQAHVAVGDSLARRYPPDIAPIAGIGTRDRRAIDELCALVPDGDVLSLPGTLEELAPLLPASVRITLQKRLVQMVSVHPLEVPSPSVDVSVLSDADVPEMLSLVALTHPGPFRPRTHSWEPIWEFTSKAGLRRWRVSGCIFPAGAKSAPSARTRHFKGVGTPARSSPVWLP